jgi:hypothetical protein
MIAQSNSRGTDHCNFCPLNLLQYYPFQFHRRKTGQKERRGKRAPGSAGLSIRAKVLAETPCEPTARILHATARHFVLCSACRCQSLTAADRLQLQKCLILLMYLVDAQGIEPWTSPV